MNKTKFLTGFLTKFFGSAKRKTQDLICQRTQKLIHDSLGGFVLQFSKFIPPSFLPDTATDQRKRVFTSEVTFWAWMSQILGCNSSCSQAVSVLIARCVLIARKYAETVVTTGFPPSKVFSLGSSLSPVGRMFRAGWLAVLQHPWPSRS